MVIQINREAIFVLLAVSILHNIAASPADETVLYFPLAFNASINVVMSVTHFFTQSFNGLNNAMFFWHGSIRHFVSSEIN